MPVSTEGRKWKGDRAAWRPVSFLLFLLSVPLHFFWLLRRAGRWRRGHGRGRGRRRAKRAGRGGKGPRGGGPWRPARRSRRGWHGRGARRAGRRGVRSVSAAQCLRPDRHGGQISIERSLLLWRQRGANVLEVLLPKRAELGSRCGIHCPARVRLDDLANGGPVRRGERLQRIALRIGERDATERETIGADARRWSHLVCSCALPAVLRRSGCRRVLRLNGGSRAEDERCAGGILQERCDRSGHGVVPPFSRRDTPRPRDGRAEAASPVESTSVRTF